MTDQNVLRKYRKGRTTNLLTSNSILCINRKYIEHYTSKMHDRNITDTAVRVFNMPKIHTSLE